jgi:hypothetical protein
VIATVSATLRRSINTPTARPGTSSCSTPAPGGTLLVLATVPGYLALVRIPTEPEAPVRVRNRQGTRTRQVMLECNPDRTYSSRDWAGLEPDRCSIVRFQQLWLQLSFRVMILSQYDLYVDWAVLPALAPHAVGCAIRAILIEPQANNDQF